eukprot:scpid85719/ scgid0076/ 
MTLSSTGPRPPWVHVLNGMSTLTDSVTGRTSSPGGWNDDVIQHWATMGTCIEWDVSDWENEQYRLHLRMSKDAFRTLHEEVGGWLERCTTNYRAPVSSAKRLAVTLHWLSQGVFPRECSQGVLLRTTARAIGAPVPLFWAT